MAKATMGRARFKIQRRLGVELPGLGKPGALERRPYPPGVHGQQRKKISEFTLRLMEKQKVVFHYGVREKELRRLVHSAKRIKVRSWVDTLIVNLEKRLDNVVFRLGMAPSLPAARQLVSHGHILVNGKRLDVPGHVVEVGDKVELSGKAAHNGNYLQAKTTPRMEVPGYLNKTPKGEIEIGTVLAEPLPEDIPFPFNKQLVIEFYWKIK